MNDKLPIEFKEFPKMARLSREIIISEKIDGTNACICIGDSGEFLTGSRTQWITPEKDNYGFSRWAHERKEELMKLGTGRHFGEWWGDGCQRGYWLPKGEKRFSLFNVFRWCLHGQTPQQIPSGDPSAVKMQGVLPPCVSLVPVLYRGMFDTKTCKEQLQRLDVEGSLASPGFRPAEGIVVWHVAGNFGLKMTLGDDGHKGQPK